MNITPTTRPAELSAAQIRTRVCRYVESVASLLPASQASAWDREGGPSKLDDSRLVALLELRDHEAPLRLCTELEAKALVLQSMCRMHQSEYKRVGMGYEVVVGGRGRQITNAEIGVFLGLGVWRVKLLLASARDSVRKALGESVRRVAA